MRIPKNSKVTHYKNLLLPLMVIFHTQRIFLRALALLDLL
nr:hypothetical protein [Fusarium oxysporum]